MLLHCLLLVAPLCVTADAPAQSLESQVTRRVRCTLTYEIRHAGVKAREWILFAPRLPELPSQSATKTEMTPTGDRSYEGSALARPILSARIPAKTLAEKDAMSITVTYEATLHKRSLKSRLASDAAVPALTEKARTLALADYGFCTHSQRDFQDWLDSHALRKTAAETDVAFARRTLDCICREFKYEYTPDSNRTCAAVCDACKSDCGGLCAVFVSALRANGIPARLLVGRWAQPSLTNERLNGTPYYQWHVKSEFFADQIGWTPVDVAHALTAGPVRGPQLHFGRDAGDFLVQHVDSHLDLNVFEHGRQTALILQNPAYYVFGDGKFDAAEFKQDWLVESVPIK